MEKLENIIFDEEDQGLFLLNNDLQLKAEAIRNSILPKLNVVINYAISQINTVYQLNVYNDSMIAQAPHFVLNNRPNEVRKDYNYARVSLKGKRMYGMWHGIRKPGGIEPQVSPYALQLKLTEAGLVIAVCNATAEIDASSHKKVFDFLLKYEMQISQLQVMAKTFDKNCLNKNDWLVIDKKRAFKNRIIEGDFDCSMVSKAIKFPIQFEDLQGVVDRLTLLYPIFHSYNQIGKGETVVFKKLIGNINNWLHSQRGQEKKVDSLKSTSIDLEAVKARADLKVKVMAGMRWQVFQRDSWRCLSCGRTADDGIILHIDHIMPRSKGGKDELGNYQTLCDICNIGKSNKNDTDIKQSRIRG